VARIHDLADIDGKIKAQLERFVLTYKQNEDMKAKFDR
jgi:hypothetical protein